MEAQAYLYWAYRSMAIQDTLQNLGLEEKEAKIYLALLELNEATVLEVARKARIKRPTCYVVLRSLEEKGFVSRVVKGNRTLFSPQHPKNLVVEAETNLKEIKEIVPQLESMLGKGEGKPRVMIYEGKEELDRDYDDSFIVGGENLYIGTIKLAMELFPRTFQRFQYKFPSAQAPFREIVDESKEGREYAEEVERRYGSKYRGIRFIPKELLPFESEIGIFGNNVVITSVKKEYFTVRIESEEIAQAFRVIFEMMWQSAKE